MAAVSAERAQAALRQLIALVLHEQGWDAAEASALQEIEDRTLHHLGTIVHLAKAYALDARRTRPQARDVVDACEEYGTTLHDLVETRDKDSGAELVPPSDEVEPAREEPEIAKLPPTIDQRGPNRLSIQPRHFPKLPHEHAYKRTPVFQTLSSEAHDTAQVQLEHRVRTSMLVETSLRNLVRKLDEAAGPVREKPLITFKLGGVDNIPIVNWETVDAAEYAASTNKRRYASAMTGSNAARRVKVRFSA